MIELNIPNPDAITSEEASGISGKRINFIQFIFTTDRAAKEIELNRDLKPSEEFLILAKHCKTIEELIYCCYYLGKNSVNK